MKCKVCEHEFKLRKKNKYIVEKTEYHFIGGAFTSFHDCFDCPLCGCQNEVNEHVENISNNYSLFTSFNNEQAELLQGDTEQAQTE